MREITINQYQNESEKTAVYPGKMYPAGITYTIMGMVGEAGEIANKYKKILRKQGQPYAHREDLMDELGDVLWYVSALAGELGYTLGEVAEHNLEKLAARKQSGTLKDR
jgi:NTP pyrophosphatase (non-canonical NTP hydrolase)